MTIEEKPKYCIMTPMYESSSLLWNYRWGFPNYLLRKACDDLPENPWFVGSCSEVPIKWRLQDGLIDGKNVLFNQEVVTWKIMDFLLLEDPIASLSILGPHSSDKYIPSDRGRHVYRLNVRANKCADNEIASLMFGIATDECPRRSNITSVLDRITSSAHSSHMAYYWRTQISRSRSFRSITQYILGTSTPSYCVTYRSNSKLGSPHVSQYSFG